MKCNTHHIEYAGPYCPRCIGDMALGAQSGVTADEVRRIVREELKAVLHAMPGQYRQGCKCVFCEQKTNEIAANQQDYLRRQPAHQEGGEHG